MTAAEYLWDRIKHEENLFTSRANYFIVAETLLFAALATDLVAAERAFVLVFCFLGIVLNLLFIVVTAYHRQMTWDPLKADLKLLGATAALGTMENHYANKAVGGRWFGSYRVIGILIPLILLAAWVWVLYVGLVHPPKNLGKKESAAAPVVGPVQPTPVPTAPRWEHVRVERSTEGWAQSQQMAGEGWELVTVDVTAYYLKRPKP